MKAGLCSQEGCERPVDCRGLCQTHYTRLRFASRICTVDGCERTQKAKGLCGWHYKERRLAGRTCSVEGCGGAEFAVGLCGLHYNRQRAQAKWNGELGLCECGCGRATEISTVTAPRRGAVVGRPRRFLPATTRGSACRPTSFG